MSKYDDALELARNYYPDNKFLDTIFPELKLVRKFKGGIVIDKTEYSELSDAEFAILRGFTRVTGLSHFPIAIIKETAQDFLAHLPVEWSEEDEKVLERAIDCVRTWEIDYCDGDNTISERLKSLRPQLQHRDTYYDIIHSILAMLKDKDFTQITPEHRVSLLNDIRFKCKIADDCAKILDEPHWKPTEEQMRAFEESLMSVAYTENKIILESLYEQLKKL